MNYAMNPICRSSDTQRGPDDLLSLVTSPCAKYYLKEHAFIRKVRRHWIILDAHHDEYYCIPAALFSSIAPLIHGSDQECHSDTSDSACRREGVAEIETELVSRGVLGLFEERRENPSESNLMTPTSVLRIDSGRIPAASRMAMLPTFLLACAIADRRLRNHTFESTIQAARARRTRNACDAIPFDITRAQWLVSVFESLRLWYPRAYLCMFDSFALLEFMALHRLYPLWTFGVSSDPFQAHCWLQAGNIAINDSLSRISYYTPIMSV
jgi:transglutaminase superfamily protein